MKKNLKKVFLAVLAVSLGIQTWTLAQGTKEYVHFVKEDGSISQDSPMDAVAVVNSTQSTLTGISYDTEEGKLKLNGLQADTLRIYASKLDVQGVNKFTDIRVNTTVEKITVASGAQLNGKITGEKAEEFLKELKEEMTVFGDSASKGSISLDKTEVTISSAGSGNTVLLKATVQGTETVKWSSSDNTVATVENGLVTGKKEGTATITAALVNSAGQEVAKATCLVSVKSAAIFLNTNAVSIYAAGTGNTATLTATVNGVVANANTVAWSSSNTGVATVNNGVVTGVKAGTADITATANGVSTVCKVTVNAPVVVLDKGTATIYAKGQNSSLALAATVNKVAVNNSTITWTSSSPAVATVTNGTVKPVKAGTTTITASFSGSSATCKVTVKEPTLSLSETSATIYTKGVKSVTLVAKENGVEVSGANVSWSSSDKTIAKVENGKVTAVAKGEATITAKVNGVSKTCKITVKKPSVSVSPTSVTIKKGKTITLTTKVKPSNGPDKPTYTSSKKSVATVDSNGVVKGVAAGEAVITVKCYGVSAEVKVTVTK